MCMGECLHLPCMSKAPVQCPASWPGLNSGMRVNSSAKALWMSLGGRYPRYPQRRHPWNWIGIKCVDSLFDGTPISGGTGSGPQGCAVCRILHLACSPPTF